MAIQVNGTTVIDNSRALTNIASVDATTAAAIGAAGVGAASVEWQNLSNSYSYTYTSSSSGNDTGMLNLSSLISGLPANWKYLAIIETSILNTNNQGIYYYAYGMNPYFTMRLGSSSSSYSELGAYFNMSQSETYYPSNYANTTEVNHRRRYGFLILDRSGPTSIFQPSTFGNPTVGGTRYYSNTSAISGPDTLILPSLGGSSLVGWSSYSIGSGTTGSTTSTFSNQNSYLGWRSQANPYSSQNGAAPNITVTLNAAYIA